jgi:hypothetical protein
MMGHNLGVQAAKAVQKGEKKQAQALRTPAERLKDIRNSCAPGCTVLVTKDDTQWLLEMYDHKSLALEGAISTIKSADAETRAAKDVIEELKAASLFLRAEITVLTDRLNQYDSTSAAIPPLT